MNHHVFFYADKLLNNSGFKDKCRRTCLHDNTVDNCKGERNLQAHTASESLGTFNIQRTAYFLDILDNHIHSHTPSGVFSNLLVCGESRQRNELVYFLVSVSGIHFPVIQKPLFPCFCQYLFPVKSLAVILHADPYFSSFCLCRQGNFSFIRLAAFSPLLVGFNTMVNSISDQMHQRIGNVFDNILIHLRVFPNHFKLDILTKLPGHIEHNTVHLLESIGQRHHTHGHDNILQIRGYLRQLCRSLIKAVQI
ncbi:hypothetical protein IMSAGC009_03518 [Lachnospiraceae bacterium]|nr:hypothetical protein IMSAGC009_03518 [Lachnospiraceae bacterium]